MSRTGTRLTELSTGRTAIPIFPKSSQTRKHRHLRFADEDISNCTYFTYSIYGNISFLLLLCVDCRIVRLSTGCEILGIIYMLSRQKLGLRQCWGFSRIQSCRWDRLCRLSICSRIFGIGWHWDWCRSMSQDNLCSY